MHASLLTPQISQDTIRSMTTTDTQADDQTLNMSGYGSLGILREYNRGRRFAFRRSRPPLRRRAHRSLQARSRSLSYTKERYKMDTYMDAIMSSLDYATDFLAFLVARDEEPNCQHLYWADDLLRLSTLLSRPSIASKVRVTPLTEDERPFDAKRAAFCLSCHPGFFARIHSELGLNGCSNPPSPSNTHSGQK